MKLDRFYYILLLGLFKTIALLPYCILYGLLSPFIYLILYHVVGYRRKVVYKNLTNSFPDKTAKEIAELERKFYHHLSDIFVDNIKIAGMSHKQAQDRLAVVNQEVMPTQDCIITMGHYGSWELSAHYSCTPEQKTMAIYRPLHNKAFDHYYNYVRCRFGASVVPMNNVLREIIAHRRDSNSRPLRLLMIADQTPAKTEQKHWYTFLNQDTSFFGGAEKLATKFKMPVYFSDIHKVKRGHYTCRFVQIFDGIEQLEDGEITRRYAAKLEEMILRQPELWIWSHRRWKHKKRV